MTDWTSGYVADVDYTYGYYPELQPHRIRLPFFERGLVAPEVTHACELGFGQGLSANIHAAASNVQWWGTDFNPAQAAFARELAKASGAPAHLFDQSFEEFCTRADLPDFDYIGLHGIWSWVSDSNRKVIVDFVRRKLRPGGVVYISYNTLPGWASMLPMRHLLARHSDMVGKGADDRMKRVDGALAFAEALLAQKPAYSRAMPGVAERLAQMKKHSRNYLVHEYFNRDWHPMHFLDMADWLQEGKLDYACSAHYFDHVEPVNMGPDQLTFLRELPDRMFREAVRDFMLNTQFRRDFWVKGSRPLASGDRLAGVKAVKVLLVTPRRDVALKVTTPLGEATLNAEVYTPLLDALAGLKPMTIGQLETAVAKKKVSFGQVMQAVMMLVGKGDLQLVQDEAVTAAARGQCDRLNRHLMNLARAHGEVGYLASPVTGTGFAVARFHQLFLQAKLQEGAGTPREMADHAWRMLQLQGQRIMHEGKQVEGDAENLAFLLTQAEKFHAETLSVLTALQIA